MADPVAHQMNAHDKSLHELREELTKAVTERKAKALPLAIEIFNRIQQKAVSRTTIDDYASRNDEGEIVIDSINESLDKMDVLLNNSSSPILSNLRASSKYATQKLPRTLEEYRATIDGGDIVRAPVDLNAIINDYQALGKTESELTKIKETLEEAQTQLKEEKENLYAQTTKKNYENWLKSSREETERANEIYLEKIYDIYLAQGNDRSVPDEVKVTMMRDAYQAHLDGEKFVNSHSGKSDSSFPAFYALDLIQFGL